MSIFIDLFFQNVGPARKRHKQSVSSAEMPFSCDEDELKDLTFYVVIYVLNILKTRKFPAFQKKFKE